VPSDAEIISALYGAILDEDALEGALALLADRFHCAASMLVSFDAASPRADVLASTGSMWTPDVMRAYHEEWGALDPSPRAYAALPSGGVAATDRLFSAEYRRHCVFFNEFYRALGYEESLGGNLSSRDGHFALISMPRDEDRSPFDDDEIAALEAFTPHLSRALQLRRTFTMLGARLDTLTQIIDRVAMGVIVLDGDGAEIHVNRAAREIAARGDGLSLDRKGALLCADRAAERSIAQLRADVRSGGAGGIARVPRRDGTAYAVLAAPLPRTASFGRLDTKAPDLLVLIHDPDARSATTPETIATIFALPIGTARMVAALADGEETKAYAERLGITMDAVKFHLKTAFAKTGLRTQARLLQAVARALTDLGERHGG
jgi:PAS domain-containing protein